MKLRCKNCGREFFTVPAVVAAGNGKYCSRECSNQAKIRKIKKNCLYCNDEFMIVPSKVELGHGKFCSKKCMGLAKRFTFKDFWVRVDIKGIDDCWEWMGWKDRDGYGQVTIARETYKTHRLSFELTYDLVLGKLSCLHTCDNPPCCNPYHLFSGTQTDNIADMVKKGRNVVRQPAIK